MRKTFLLSVLALPVMSACSGSSAPPTTSVSESAVNQFAEATFTTPLEARKNLLSLGIFPDCATPRDQEGASSFSCFLSEGETGWKTKDRQVFVIVSREDSSCEKFLSEAMPDDYPVVTDDKTFVAVGLMNSASPLLGPDADYPSFVWPEELWPEDVARVLGGKVVAVNEWCPEAFD